MDFDIKEFEIKMVPRHGPPMVTKKKVMPLYPLRQEDLRTYLTKEAEKIKEHLHNMGKDIDLQQRQGEIFDQTARCDQEVRDG
jgi:hypothetical protein